MQTDRVIDHIVNWLLEYCENHGLNGFVVGVSGGIDSAVTSTLCAKTKKEVIALNMPIYQASHQVSLSSQHIEWLSKRFGTVRGIHVDLTPQMQCFEKILPEEIQDGLTMANTRSRIRMVTLYAFASHHKMLVAGTGNKVEDFGIGFFTKYGDGGVDISPIADLLKSEVYLVAKKLDIIEEIINSEPTDGLWGDNRTDEHQIGATYAELEWAMGVEKENETKGLKTERQKEIMDIYKTFHTANRHKMEKIPVCLIPDALR
jgi:NAD+ synthase